MLKCPGVFHQVVLGGLFDVLVDKHYFWIYVFSCHWVKVPVGLKVQHDLRFFIGEATFKDNGFFHHFVGDSAKQVIWDVEIPNVVCFILDFKLDLNFIKNLLVDFALLYRLRCLLNLEQLVDIQ